MYIFIDESGQFTKHNHEEYFILGSFTVWETPRTSKRFRAWCMSHFPKKMRRQQEIKWSSDIGDRLRLKTLRYISRLDVRIRFAYLLRDNIPLEYWKKDKLQSGHLYANIVGDLLEMYLPSDETQFHVMCDQRHLKSLKRSEFISLIRSRLVTHLPKNALVDVHMVDSATNPNIQIADWIAGALARYLEKRPLGEECYLALKNNFMSSGKELFATQS